MMPFSERINRGKNKGKFLSHPPGGRKGKIYTAKQVRAYFATNAWSRPVRKPRGHK